MDEQNQTLLSSSQKDKFKSIYVYDIRNRRILKKGINAWKVFTVLNKNVFVITIIDFYITYGNRNYNFANGGGSKTTFEYSCEDHKWKLISFEIKGI